MASGSSGAATGRRARACAPAVDADVDAPALDRVEDALDERGLDRDRVAAELAVALDRPYDRVAAAAAVEMLEPQVVAEEVRDAGLERVELRERVLAQAEEEVRPQARLAGRRALDLAVQLEDDRPALERQLGRVRVRLVDQGAGAVGRDVAEPAAVAGRSRAPRRARAGPAGRRRAPPPAGPTGRARASAARESARGADSRRRAPRARPRPRRAGPPRGRRRSAPRGRSAGAPPGGRSRTARRPRTRTRRAAVRARGRAPRGASPPACRARPTSPRRPRLAPGPPRAGPGRYRAGIRAASSRECPARAASAAGRRSSEGRSEPSSAGAHPRARRSGGRSRRRGRHRRGGARAGPAASARRATALRRSRAPRSARGCGTRARS